MGFWWLLIAVVILVVGAALLLGGAGALPLAGILLVTIVGAVVLWKLATDTRRLS
jgi:hypothetical protein